MEEDAIAFWNRVNPLIKAQKTTQKGLAKICNIPFGTLNGWLAYNRLPDAISAYRIAQALGVTVEYLVTGQDPAKPDPTDALHKLEDVSAFLKKLTPSL